MQFKLMLSKGQLYMCIYFIQSLPNPSGFLLGIFVLRGSAGSIILGLFNGGNHDYDFLL